MKQRMQVLLDRKEFEVREGKYFSKTTHQKYEKIHAYMFSHIGIGTVIKETENKLLLSIEWRTKKGDLLFSLVGCFAKTDLVY